MYDTYFIYTCLHMFMNIYEMCRYVLCVHVYLPMIDFSTVFKRDFYFLLMKYSDF